MKHAGLQHAPGVTSLTYYNTSNRYILSCKSETLKTIRTHASTHASAHTNKQTYNINTHM